MKKLKLKENEVVHCATLKQAKKVLKIMCNDVHIGGQEQSTYFTIINNTEIILVSVDYIKEKQLTIITSKEFLKRHKKKNKYKVLEDRIKLIESTYNQELSVLNTQLSKCIEDVEVLQAIVNATNEIVNIVKSDETTEETALRVFEEACKEVEQPQIGDVVKAWSEEESDSFVYGKLEQKSKTYLVSGNWYKNIEKVTEININDFKK